MIHGLLRYKRLWPLAALVILLAWARWWPMDPLFEQPCSTVLMDEHGRLLGAGVAADGQWRMPPTGHLPERFVHCLIQFEDRRFYRHPGIHLPSLVRAWNQNRKAGRTVSGGSTITMQLARMSRNGRSRTYWNKVVEMLLALRIEIRYSKEEILGIYAANAPFGGNVVGLEAASWRWFGRPAHELGWADCATLAVLPNAPARIHPGKKRDALRAKRDRLLGRLAEAGLLDSVSWSLAVEEPLPEAPLPLPRLAPHLLSTLQKQGWNGKRIECTLDAALQAQVASIAELHAAALRGNGVHNAAVLVMDMPSGKVLAYLGNLASAGKAHSGDVDIVHAPRSTGSLLKPFLYASMLQHGERMPDQLVADIPTRYEGFAPHNYEQNYSGAVRASSALARSLNVPAVRALHEHGIDRTLRMLRAMGFEHIDRSADHYGLSLIVGGSESTLWELAGAYGSLARIAHQGRIENAPSPIHPPRVLHHTATTAEPGAKPPFSAAAAYHTLRALQQTDRPGTSSAWQQFGGNETIAWKTGTSFGHRDAWAIGVTDRYVVAVWTGNASGEGRPELTGSLAAAPMLFDLFRILPNGNGFEPTYDQMERMSVCRRSGHRASTMCPVVDSTWTLEQAIRTTLCPYHMEILTNAEGTERVRPSEGAVRRSWFVLPPAMEYYQMSVDPTYRPMPPWAAQHAPDDDTGSMELIYPQKGARIMVPVQLDGSHGLVVFELAHRDPTATVQWHLDGEHIGTTTKEHRLAADLQHGPHRLTLTDRLGTTISTTFTVDRGISRKR